MSASFRKRTTRIKLSSCNGLLCVVSCVNGRDATASIANHEVK